MHVLRERTRGLLRCLWGPSGAPERTFHPFLHACIPLPTQDTPGLSLTTDVSVRLRMGEWSDAAVSWKTGAKVTPARGASPRGGGMEGKDSELPIG
eukprot:5211724-Pyramimonas_sp.AAC.1